MEEIKTMTDAYDAAAVQIKNALSDILAQVDMGQVPSDEQVSTAASQLKQLQEAYYAIKELAEKLGGKLAAGKGPMSVRAYADIVEKAQRSKRREQLEGYLQRFMRVQSDSPAFEDALAPYRDEARRLLGRFRSSDASGKLDENRVKRTEEFRLFTQAVELEEFESDEAMKMLDRLENGFSAKVQRGLLMKKYTIADTQAPLPPQSELDLEPLEEEQESSGPMVRARVKIKQAKVSAASFKREIFRMPKEIQAVLPLFTNLGVLTAPQLLRFGQLTHCFKTDPEEQEKASDGIARTLTQLVNKGIAAVYDLEGEDEPVYCLTRYGSDCLAKKNICVDMRAFWHLSFGRYRFCGQDEMEEAVLRRALGHTTALLSYLNYAEEHCAPYLLRPIKSSIHWVRDHFDVVVPLDLGLKITCALRTGEEGADWKQDTLLVFPDCLRCVPQVDEDEDAFCFALDEDLYLWEDDEWVPHDLEEVSRLDEDDESEDEEDDELEDSGEGDADAEEDDAPPEEFPAPGEPEEDVPAESEADIARREACQALIDAADLPEDDVFMDLACRLIQEDSGDGRGLKNAVLLAKTACFRANAREVKTFYAQLAYGTNMGLDEVPYTGQALSEVFETEGAFTESCRLSACLYGCLFPAAAYDYALNAFVEGMVDRFEEFFPSFPCMKGLLHTAQSVCGENISPEGFSERMLDILSYQDESMVYSRQLRRRAETLMPEPKIKARITGIPAFLSACFGKGSDLNFCLQVVAEDDREQRDGVLDIMARYTQSLEDIQISEELVAETVEEEWRKATRGKKTDGLSLEYQARKQVDEGFYQRLELIRDWLDYSDPRKSAAIPELRRIKAQLMAETEECAATLLRQQTEEGCDGGRTVVLWMLRQVRRRLEDRMQGEYPYEDLLRTGFFSLNDQGLPVLRPALDGVKYAEPWRAVLRHIAAPAVSWDKARDRVFDNTSPTFDNLRQLQMIGRCREEDSSEVYAISSADLINAQAAAGDVTEQFLDGLELAYTYNRVFEGERQALTALVDRWRENFFELQDFGCWRQFLDSLRRQMDEFAAGHRGALSARLDACQQRLVPGESSSLLDAARRLLEEGNFAVAEEYCVRFEAGQRQAVDELAQALPERDSFAEFLSDQVFAPLYNECIRKSGQSLSLFGPAYLEGRLSGSLDGEGRKLLSVWPSGGHATGQQVESFLSSLGLTVLETEQIPGRRQELYRLRIAPVPQGLAGYSHPIAALGTRMEEPLNVVVIYGKIMAQELVDAIVSLELAGLSIVLIDSPLDRAARRQIAEIFHTRAAGGAPFLMIDQVLAMHLAVQPAKERLPVMLKCTMPYTYYQPFASDGGAVADEMFRGRADELKAVTDLWGALVVCGGYQQGKTALLQRARGLFHRPEDMALAVYSNLGGADSEREAAGRISADVAGQTDLPLTSCQSLGELSGQLEALFRRGTVKFMLLLLDNADNFWDGIAGKGFTALRPLLDLREACGGRFKFVLTCLHNICLDAPEGSIPARLGEPVRLRPLPPAEALGLLARPLRCLGFQVDRRSHLETILVNANYTPGILQFFGAALVQTLTSQYGRCYRAVDGNPPYALRDEQLGAVLHSADLNGSVRARFRQALERDPRYFMLARCVAMLCYEAHSDTEAFQEGFTRMQIMDMAAQVEVKILTSESPFQLEGLLDEMTDMGVLSRADGAEKRYRLRRRGFLNIIGSDMDAVLNDMILAGKEGV